MSPVQPPVRGTLDGAPAVVPAGSVAKWHFGPGGLVAGGLEEVAAAPVVEVVAAGFTRTRGPLGCALPWPAMTVTTTRTPSTTSAAAATAHRFIARPSASP